jgi:hypothetical protein
LYSGINGKKKNSYLRKSQLQMRSAMGGKVHGGLESCSGPGVVRSASFVRRLLDAVQRARGRTAAREAERDLETSGEKLTDEMERKMMEQLTRNRSFRP